jgi:hypothetical protein
MPARSNRRRTRPQEDADILEQVSECDNLAIETIMKELK